MASVRSEPETVGCFILVNVHADLTTFFVHDVKCQSTKKEREREREKKRQEKKRQKKNKRKKKKKNGRKMPAPPGRPITESFQNQGK